MQLRTYQKECIDKIMWAQQLPGNDLIQLPTGAGKSIVIAEIASRIQKDILILQPTKEILEQNYEKLCKYVDPSLISIYSASMNEKVIKQYTLATIGSIYKKPELFAHFKLIILDECHLLNPKNLEGMFTSFLKAIGNPKVIGLTATPYRLTPMYIKSSKPWISEWEIATSIKLINRLKEHFWSRLLYVVNYQDLVNQNFLVPIRYEINDLLDEGSIKINKSRSDFDMSDWEDNLIEYENTVSLYVEDAKKEYKSVLIFCPGVESAQSLSITTKDEYICADTPKKERTRIINGFKNGSIKAVYNVGVLTTGFDHPALDCIIMARPTQSIGLYYQMAGRGVRLSPGKTHCTLIDLCGNVTRMGRIETIKTTKNPEGKWDLQSETGYWHGVELYRFSSTQL